MTIVEEIFPRYKAHDASLIFRIQEHYLSSDKYEISQMIKCFMTVSTFCRLTYIVF